MALFGELNWSLGRTLPARVVVTCVSCCWCSRAGVVLQAEDRIHRLGQLAKTVRIIYMIARNTVDEIVWEQIQRKHQVVGATVGKARLRLHADSVVYCTQHPHSMPTLIIILSYISCPLGTSETRSYGGGMRISAYREDGTSTSSSSAGSGPSAAEQEAIVAGFHNYASKNASRTPLPGPCSEPKIVESEVSCPSVAGPSMTAAPSAQVMRPLPPSYQAAALAAGQAPAQYSGAGTGPAAAPPVARQLFNYGTAPGPTPSLPPPVLPPQAPTSAVPPLCARPEEFSYSASTQATDGMYDAILENTMRGSNGSSNPFATAPSFRPPISASGVPTAPVSGGNPFAPAPALPQTAHAIPAVPAGQQYPTPSIYQPASKSTLAPEVLARIEANRQAAQARLAAAKMKNEQQAASAVGGTPASSFVTARTYPPHNPHNAPPLPVPGVPSSYPKSALPPASLGSPGTALGSRAPSINEPPLAIRPSPAKNAIASAPASSSAAPAPSHVFSTGKGSSVHVTEEQMQRAGALLSTASGPPSVQHPLAPAVYVDQVASTASAPPAPTGVVHSPAAGGSATLFFDGGSLGNPGKGGAGYQLFADNGRTIKESSVRLTGLCTNNQAEYVGLVHGLTAALHSGVQDLSVYGNSEVVIKQMTGQYQVKNPVLMDLFQRADVLRQQFRRVALQWIPKDKNSGADRLTKRALHQPEAASEAADWFRV